MVHDLDRGERIVLVDGIGHDRKRRNVCVGPEPPFVKRLAVARGMDFYFFGGDHGRG